MNNNIIGKKPVTIEISKEKFMKKPFRKFQPVRYILHFSYCTNIVTCYTQVKRLKRIELNIHMISSPWGNFLNDIIEFFFDISTTHQWKHSPVMWNNILWDLVSKINFRIFLIKIYLLNKSSFNSFENLLIDWNNFEVYFYDFYLDMYHN